MFAVRNDSYEAKLSEYSIVAPVSGLISKLTFTNIGEIAGSGTTLMEIIPEDQPIVFYAQVPVDAVVDVEVGQLAKVTLQLWTQDMKSLLWVSLLILIQMLLLMMTVQDTSALQLSFLRKFFREK